MITQSIDTHPDAERVQIELIRKMTPAQKFYYICSISQKAIDESKRAIKQAHPNASKQELDVLFVEYNYGKELAERFKKYLDARVHGA
jgi:hypothetical protein